MPELKSGKARIGQGRFWRGGHSGGGGGGGGEGGGGGQGEILRRWALRPRTVVSTSQVSTFRPFWISLFMHFEGVTATNSKYMTRPQ